MRNESMKVYVNFRVESTLFHLEQVNVHTYVCNYVCIYLHMYAYTYISLSMIVLNSSDRLKK